jgi:hypothetical protein
MENNNNPVWLILPDLTLRNLERALFFDTSWPRVRLQPSSHSPEAHPMRTTTK